MLEERVERLQGQYAEIRHQLGNIEGRLDDMPSKDFMTTRLVWVVGAFTLLATAVSGLIGYAQQVTGGAQIP